MNCVLHQRLFLIIFWIVVCGKNILGWMELLATVSQKAPRGEKSPCHSIFSQVPSCYNPSMCMIICLFVPFRLYRSLTSHTGQVEQLGPVWNQTQAWGSGQGHSRFTDGHMWLCPNSGSAPFEACIWRSLTWEHFPKACFKRITAPDSNHAQIRSSWRPTSRYCVCCCWALWEVSWNGGIYW